MSSWLSQLVGRAAHRREAEPMADEMFWFLAGVGASLICSVIL